MTNPALILLHAPSVYDFRIKTILRGPISDLVPSSSVFEMYPIGFTTIAIHLEDRGYPVRIINLAARMLQDHAFDVEKFIGELPEPLVFGIDLHWLPHAHGSLEIAKIIKSNFPDVPILFGGFSSTYYHEELIRYPQVDLVMRGDSTEEAVYALMEALRRGQSLDSVPNLTWQDAQGDLHINPFTAKPADFDFVDLDFRRVMMSAVRQRDLQSYLPFIGWLKYPIMPVVSCRGCVMNCVGCGGSAFAFKKLHNRDKPAFRSPEKLAEDMFHIASISNGPIFVLGDIRQAGAEYAQQFLSAVAGIDVPVIIELFSPAHDKFFGTVAKSIPHFALEVSIESHDPVVRQAFGKHYGNSAFEDTLRSAFAYGAQRIDLFFMAGLPKQTYQSVLESADYAETLLKTFGKDKRLRPFIGPMAPFIDPGSLAFEQPEKHGYHIFYRSLEEHRKALLEPSWQFTLNYETNWMSRHDIVQSTYAACLRFSELKGEYSLISVEDTRNVQDTLRQGQALAQEIEDLYVAQQWTQIEQKRLQIETVNNAQGIEENEQLKLAVHRRTFKWMRLIGWLIKSWSRQIFLPKTSS